MNTFELEITNDPSTNGAQTPVDDYLYRLLEDAKQGFKTFQWETVEGEKPSYPSFKILDTEKGLLSELCRTVVSDTFVRYSLSTIDTSNGSVLYRYIELLAPEATESPLGELYIMRTEYLMAQEDEALAAEKTIDGDNVTVTNSFIDALIEDAQSPNPYVQFERCADGFVVESFGISESTITLTKDFESDDEVQFTIKMANGNFEVLRCTEKSRLSDTDAELHRLYSILDELVPLVTTDDALIDAKRYIEEMRYREMRNRIMCRAKTPTISEESPPEGAILIYDIFESISEPATVKMFLDAVSLQRGPLSEPAYKRLKTLAQNVFGIIRNVKRRPQNCIFKSRNLVKAYYCGTEIKSKHARFSSALSTVANCYITWPAEIYGLTPVTGDTTIMMKCATLILMAILSEELP